MAKTYIDKRGYRRFSDSKRLVHRWVVKKNGCKLSRYQQVHHIDGNKLNNNIDNLQVASKREHQLKHGITTKNKNITIWDFHRICLWVFLEIFGVVLFIFGFFMFMTENWFVSNSVSVIFGFFGLVLISFSTIVLLCSGLIYYIRKYFRERATS